MEIQSIIFNILQRGTWNWVRYWVQKESQGTTSRGEYIEVRSYYMSGLGLQELLDAGFEIDTIRPKKDEADCYCDILLKRDLNYQYQNKAENG